MNDYPDSVTSIEDNEDVSEEQLRTGKKVKTYRMQFMSKVKNEPKYKNSLLQAIRAQLEHRAFWLYLLCDEASRRGLDPRDFGSAAVKRCGLFQGVDLVKKGRTDSLKGLKKVLFNKPAQLVFEMDVLKSTDDELNIDFHYCPLVKAWQKAGCSDEEIASMKNPV